MNLVTLHCPMTKAKAKLWSRHYTGDEVDAAMAELVEKAYAVFCRAHLDCMIVVHEGQGI